MQQIFDYILNFWKVFQDQSMSFIIAQIVGVFTFIVAIMAAQFKNIKYVYLCEIIANMMVALNVLLLGGSVGPWVCTIASVQTVFSYYYVSKDLKPPTKLTVIFILIYILVSALTFKVALDVVPAICAIFYALSVAQKKASRYRLFMLLNCLVWIIYDVSIGAWTAIATFLMQAISIVVAFIRFKDWSDISQ